MSSFIHRRGHRRRVSLRCTGDARISFAVKLLDGVVLDKTISDQVRLHHTIFSNQFVMAPNARTYGALPTQTLTMIFRSGNKLSHIMQKSQIVTSPRHLVHPLCPVHGRDLAHSEKLESDKQI